MTTASDSLNLIAVPSATECSGVLTHWTFTGEAKLTDLQAAWVAQGLDTALPPRYAPKAPSPAEALGRAVRSVASAKRYVIRTHPKGGLVIIPEHVTEDGEDLDLQSGHRLRCQWVHGSKDAPGEIRYSDPAHPLAPLVTNAFAHYRGVVTAGDFGDWLPQVAQGCDAVSIRHGVYFVPAGTAEDTWDRVRTAVLAVAQVGSRVYRMPVLKAEEALEAVVDAVMAQATKLSERIAAEVAAGLGDKATDTRVAEIGKAYGQIALYERVLGTSLEAARATLHTTQVTLTGVVCAAPLGALAAA